MRLHITPHFGEVDNGDGGIRRVVEAQRKYLPQYGFEIVESAQEADIGAVHASTWIPGDIPIVEHCHGLYWQEYEWPVWCHRMNEEVISSVHRANLVTAPSEWVANVLRRGMWVEPIVIPHGVNAEEWRTDDEHEGYVLWNKTRLDPVCDVEPVNDLARVDKAHQYVSTYGSNDVQNLLITGTLPFDKAKRAVQRAGIYLCTARETFGIGTLEAMASGVPVVGWAWGGQRDIVQHKVTGWLVKPGDIDGLREGVEYCLKHRKRMSKACREYVQKNAQWSQIIEQYAQVYHRAYAEYTSVRPKVSVVITNYKLEKYLLDCIESVYKGGLARGEYEIVVVDDNSPTWDTEFEKMPDVRVVHNTENLYLAGALNAGISVAQGKYIVPLDADNMLAPNSLKTLSDALDKDKQIDIAYGAMSVIEDGKQEWVSPWPSDFSYVAQITHHNQIPSTSMYRRTVWERSGGYRRRCRTAEDADFWCRVTSLGFTPKKVTDAVVLRYRDRQDSMSHVQQDWDWTAWYPWNRMPEITPFAAVDLKRPNVPSYEPTLISVIIPVGPNHRDMVIDAVDSLCAQTFQQWECIVVNDSGSPLKWIHPFVKVIDSYADDSVNRVAHARNKGISSASAKLFILLDADDYLQPNALDEMYRAYSPGTYVYSDWYIAETMEAHQTPEYTCESVLQRLHHAVTCLYEKAAWEKVGGLDENLRGWEDWDFIIALNAHAGVCGVRVPKPLLYYRLHAGQRREELFANKTELVIEMHNKWHEYIEGEKKLMACGSCGGAAGSLANASLPSPIQQSYRPDPSGDTLLIEYIGNDVGPMTFRGHETGHQYRFGSDPEHRIKYVFKQDVPYLMQMPDLFQEFTSVIPDSPVLVAAGPPVQ